MTIIAAYASPDGNSIAFGSDRIVVDGSLKFESEPKWKRLSGNVYVGTAGGFAFTNQIEAQSGEDMRCVFGEGLDVAGKWLADIAQQARIPLASNVAEHRDAYYGLGAIIIIPGLGMWEVGGDLVPTKVIAGQFVASGAGATLAYGAASVATRANSARMFDHLTPSDIVLESIRSAIECSIYCSGPIDIWAMGKDMKAIHKEISK